MLMLTGVKSFHRQYKWSSPQLLTQPVKTQYPFQAELNREVVAKDPGLEVQTGCDEVDGALSLYR
jgi:hypothetical protein